MAILLLPFNLDASYFLWLLCLGLTLTMLNKSGHPCLAHDLKENSFRVSPLSMLAVGLSYTAFIMLSYVPSLLAFSASIDMIIWFLSFILFMWYISLIDSWIMNQLCILGTNPTLSWCMIFLIYCQIRFADILLRIFTSIFTRDVTYNFLFLLYLCLVLESC